MTHTLSSPPIRVVLVEDDDPCRQALRALIHGTPGYTVLADFDNAEDALKGIPKTGVDVAVIDLHLPKKSGVDLIRALVERQCACEMLVLTVADEAREVFEALEAGATGYLVKGTLPARFLESIRELREGGSPMSPEIARLVLRRVHEHGKNQEQLSILSLRQREILELLADALTYDEIAARLGISPRTVGTHTHEIYHRLRVRSRAAAVHKLRRS